MSIRGTFKVLNAFLPIKNEALIRNNRNRQSQCRLTKQREVGPGMTSVTNDNSQVAGRVSTLALVHRLLMVLKIFT